MENIPSTTLSTSSNSSGNTIPQMFATIGAAAGRVARDGYRALVSVIDTDKFRWMLTNVFSSLILFLFLPRKTSPNMRFSNDPSEEMILQNEWRRERMHQAVDEVESYVHGRW
jgi:hypothetical protein